MALPKKLRLKSNALKEYKKSRPSNSFSTKSFYIKYYSRDTLKFAIILLKKHINKASTRNYIKRRIHAYIISNVPSFKKGSYIIISKRGLNKSYSYEDISAEFNTILSKVS